MDVNGPYWNAYEQAFQALAETANPWRGQKPSLIDTQYYLCLYGENGLSPEEEFELLNTMAQHQPLFKIEIETAYWQEIVLFVPCRVIPTT